MHESGPSLLPELPELLPEVPELEPEVPDEPPSPDAPELLLLAELLVLLDELGVSSPLQPTITNKDETLATKTMRKDIQSTLRNHKYAGQQPDLMT